MTGTTATPAALKSNVRALWQTIVAVDDVFAHRYGERWQLPDTAEGERCLVAWITLWHRHEAAARALAAKNRRWTSAHAREVMAFKRSHYGTDAANVVPLRFQGDAAR